MALAYGFSLPLIFIDLEYFWISRLLSFNADSMIFALSLW